MLCIAAPNLWAPSETFVRNHIENIHPNRTVVALLGKDEIGDAKFPVHRVLIDEERCDVLSSWRKLLNLAVRGCTTPLSPTENQKLIQFLKDRSVSILMAEYGSNGCLVREACRAAGVALYVHYHGWDASYALRRRSYRIQYRILGRIAKNFICPSQFILENLAAIGINRRMMSVVPCGVNVDTFKCNTLRDDNLVLAVGRFVEKKAPQHTIAAFAGVLQRQPNARLEMIGDGPLMSTCVKQVEDLNIQGNVIFHGAQSASFVRQKMSEASVFVQHSVTAKDGNTEGLPVSVLEAMAAQLPVVSTRHAGIPEAVIDGRTGLLVDEHDIKGMAEATARLLREPKQRLKMGDAARQDAIAKFSHQVQFQKLRSVMGIEPRLCDR